MSRRADDLLARLPEASRREVEPLVRALAHDLKGLIWTASLEAYNLDQDVAGMGDLRPEDLRRSIESAREGIHLVQESLERATAYLTRVEAALNPVLAPEPAEEG